MLAPLALVMSIAKLDKAFLRLAGLKPLLKKAAHSR
jgi:hypothetical protein